MPPFVSPVWETSIPLWKNR